MTDVIRRKIDRARQPQAEGAPGADRGWRLALARATRDTMGLDLDFRRLTIARASLAEVLELAPDRALLALLCGPRETLGVLMLSPLVTATLIEMQTLGRLSPQPPQHRKPTRIDAAMVAGVVDRALAGLDEVLAEEADLVWAGGFRYASYLDEVRPLGLMLEDEPYRVLSAEVVMGADGRAGQVLLVLPANGRGDLPSAVDTSGAETLTHFTTGFAAQVMQVDCRIDAVIGRLVLPIRQIMALQPGDVLGLPAATLEAVALETADGVSIAQAKLGQHRGMRALKLLEVNPTSGAAPLPQVAEPKAAVAPPPDLRAAG